VKLVPFPVWNGKHTVKVTSSGYKGWSRELVTDGGAEVHLTANLEKLTS
jgi:hypothetical protein